MTPRGTDEALPQNGKNGALRLQLCGSSSWIQLIHLCFTNGHCSKTQREGIKSNWAYHPITAKAQNHKGATTISGAAPGICGVF